MAFSYGGADDYQKNLRSRIFIITGLIFASFFVLLLRLWYLQVVQEGSLQKLAESNRMRKVTFPGFRGNIFDRNGVELVSSRPSYNLTIIREDVADLDGILTKLQKFLPLNKKKIKKAIRSRPSFEPFVIAGDISRDIAANIEEARFDLPGVYFSIEPIRVYRYDSFATHFIGYLGEISSKQLKNGMYKGYRQGDIVGKSGIEDTFEPLLRGHKGTKIIEVDATGRELKVLKKLEAGAGKDLYLSLDFDTQMVAEDAMKEYKGVAVALNPNTGEILAMVSSPGFDLNRFANGVKHNYWQKLLNNEYHPLNNRAIQGLYSPGSTYKIIVALAALQEGVIDENTEFYCPGYFRLGRKKYRCWKKSGHGKISLRRAIQQSCDVYFYNVGLKLGVDNIAKWAEKLGLNRITGVSLKHESSGLIPTTAWKEKHRHEPWIKGETLSVAIGQGFDLVTPLQMAVAVSAVANGGKLVTPRLLRVDKKSSSDGNSFGKDIGLDSENLKKVQEAMVDVVNKAGGTARRARIRGIKVAGKTGTAQVIGQSEEDLKKKHDEIPEKFRDHAWFISYAPAEDAKIAVAVILEHAGHGGSTAAPVAKKIIKAYLNKIKKQKNTNLAMAN